MKIQREGLRDEIELTNQCEKGTINVYDEENAVPIGYLNYSKREERFKHGIDSMFVILGVWVNPDYRKRGAGTKLYQELCNIAKECNIYAIYGHTNSEEAVRARRRVFGKPLEYSPSSFDAHRIISKVEDCKGE